MQKPPKCYQKWNEMERVEGGRICAQCDKKIVNLSSKSWDEIITIQKASNYATCAMYSKKQLRYWGHQPPAIDLSRFRSLKVASLMVFLGLKTANAKSNPIPLMEQVENINDEERKAIAYDGKVVFNGQVVDSATGDPVAFATIVVVGNSTVGHYSDVDGRFSIILDDSEYDSIKVRVQYLGMDTKEVFLFPGISNTITLREQTIIGHRGTPSIIAFGVTPQTPKDKLLQPIRRLKYKVKRVAKKITN
jgi:hypothetical protein